ncbi:MAG: glycogen-binding domain-containing protein [Gemmatimonadota bacterium]
MDIRMQKALDGELAREELTREQVAELAEAEALFQGIIRAVPVDPVPDLSGAVLRRLEEVAPARSQPARTPVLEHVRTAFGWLWQPRPVQWRPAYAFGALAIMAGLLLVRPVPDPAITPAPVPAATPVAQVFIQFRLDAPQARQVALAGDFTEWKPAHELTRSSNGTWTVVVPVQPGVHEYAFVVDGQRWVPDPTAPAVEDGFGGLNSRLAVLTPDARSL